MRLHNQNSARAQLKFLYLKTRSCNTSKRSSKEETLQWSVAACPKSSFFVKSWKTLIPALSFAWTMGDPLADAMPLMALRSKVGIVKMFRGTEAGSKEDDGPPAILHWPALIFDSVEIFESEYKQALEHACLPKLPVTLVAVATELQEYRKEKRRSGTTSKVEGKVAFLFGEDRMPKLAFENEFRSVVKVGDEERPIEPVHDMECVADDSLTTVEAQMQSFAFSQVSLILSGKPVGERNEITDAPEFSPLRLCYHRIAMIDGTKTKHILWPAIRIRNTKNFILEIAKKSSKVVVRQLLCDAFDINRDENNTVYLFGHPPPETSSETRPKIIPYDCSKIQADLSATLMAEYHQCIPGYDEAIQEPMTLIRTITDQNCCICMCDVELDDLSKINCCKHSFCFGCIEKWSERENTCPLCKSRFTTIDRVNKKRKKGVKNTKKVR